LGGLSFAYSLVEVADGAHAEYLLPLMVLFEDFEHLVLLDEGAQFIGIRP
jgi:hypothetical protein